MVALGRQERAIEWADKWVTAQRLLVDGARSDAVRGLAEALRHLAALHVEVGHREEAVAAAAEAIRRYAAVDAHVYEAQIEALQQIAELAAPRRAGAG
jgi:hypothetical protein